MVEVLVDVPSLSPNIVCSAAQPMLGVNGTPIFL